MLLKKNKQKLNKNKSISAQACTKYLKYYFALFNKKKRKNLNKESEKINLP